MSDTTVVNLTDDSPINPQILNLCRKHLWNAAQGLPMVVVSQTEVITNCRNIRMGPIPHCWLSMYQQLLAGVTAAETKYVVITERDLLYTKEHLNWVPLDDDNTWHNDNMWMVQWYENGRYPELNGMFSWLGNRLSWAQMVSNRLLLKECMEERLAAIQASPRALYLATAHQVLLPKIAKHTPEHYAKWDTRMKKFRTEVPIIDIRHDNAFSGPRRGSKRSFELQGWGKWEGILAGSYNCLLNS